MAVRFSTQQADPGGYLLGPKRRRRCRIVSSLPAVVTLRLVPT
jgi:hypothetical protein